MTGSDRHPFAKRSFGQNFLVDQDYVRKIVDDLELAPKEQVIEIGPGRGALSEELLERGARITAIELDRDMIALLKTKFVGYENFHLVETDVLKADFTEFVDSPSVKLVANLPYYISTPILRRLISERRLFSRLVLMFQREVAERIAAPVGSRDRGFLTVLVEATMKVERLFDVPPAAFRPAPKVWSSVVKLTPRYDELLDFQLLEDIASAGFAQKRKTLLNNLKARFADAPQIFATAGIDPSKRAEALSLDDWFRLARAVESAKS